MIIRTTRLFLLIVGPLFVGSPIVKAMFFRVCIRASDFG